MKKYQSPDMKLIAFLWEDVLAFSGGLETPPVPLSLRRSPANSDLKENGSYDIF